MRLMRYPNHSHVGSGGEGPSISIGIGKGNQLEENDLVSSTLR